MKKDISHFAIRVICPRYDSNNTNNLPKDVEGTLLYVIGYSKKADNLIKCNKFLQLIYTGNARTNFIVRWDHDKKDILTACDIVIRSFGRFQLYSSIWENINLRDILDTRKYYELRPLTKSKYKFEINYKLKEEYPYVVTSINESLEYNVSIADLEVPVLSYNDPPVYNDPPLIQTDF